MIKKIADYLGNPKNTGKLKKILYISVAMIVLSDFLVHREHTVFFWDKIPGWSAFYGFISTVALIVIAKIILHHLIMRREDYYD